MPPLDNLPNTDLNQDVETQRLERFALRFSGDFALGLVRGNSTVQRRESTLALCRSLMREGLELVILDLSGQEISDLYPIINDRVLQAPWFNPDKSVLLISGLEKSIKSDSKIADPVLGAINVQRDRFADYCRFPFILWLPDYAMDLLQKYAPDFQDFYSATVAIERAADSTFDVFIYTPARKVWSNLCSRFIRG